MEDMNRAFTQFYRVFFYISFLINFIFGGQTFLKHLYSLPYSFYLLMPIYLPQVKIPSEFNPENTCF
ncbi:hypothetical protein DU86_03960 [Methanosarcina mazei]|uniref:Uncharacterized protein n=1 Tax=Methanosarcina mazei TaxID=2209 RepID=A0A0F8SLT5_METMZ|nr:hypothetical protein DU40_17920 [Methanosarcina mazei]KKG07114.1 hypothetical protein DU31_12305 [Methanosarcina mazei]KKG56909.1 hypothetical protein DU64_05365 [Methanosarcina mazei]KKG57579.1 hypothetical protein DU33_19430 [Methanosarcina mazei]KKG63414.1 hypothetical protein DU45_20365 [Methanosarcina mazei]